MRKAMPTYVDYKYKADKNLVQRTAFQWTILRPGGLADEPGTGKASVGKTHLRPTISVRFLNDETVKAKLTGAKTLSEIDIDSYDVIFYPGGHGPMIDLAFDELNGKLASKVLTLFSIWCFKS